MTQSRPLMPASDPAAGYSHQVCLSLHTFTGSAALAIAVSASSALALLSSFPRPSSASSDFEASKEKFLVEELLPLVTADRGQQSTLAQPWSSDEPPLFRDTMRLRASRRP